MRRDRIRRVRRALVGICALATVWAATVALTGGFYFHLFGRQISSRNPQNPTLIALLTAVAAWALPMPDRRRVLRQARDRWTKRFSILYSRWPRVADPAALIALFGIWLQVAGWLRARPLWLDEEMIALNLRDRSIVDLTRPLWLGQSAPFGWLALQRGVLLTLGTSEVALRLLPVVFGVATLVAAAWTARRWLTGFGATLFVLLCAVAPWLAHYPLELKHYSADAFSGLLLPAFAAWAIEADGPESQQRRARIWWVLAAVSQWCANGGLLVTPACAVFLLAMFWRKAGSRGAVMFALAGAVWVISLALHYVVSVRHTIGSGYLRSYWAGGLPPESIGGAELLNWLGSRFEPLAANPGGTEHWILFWLAALCGFAAARGAIGLLFATVPLSACVLGVFGLVPLIDRIALWTIPALYFGVSSFADMSVRLAHTAYTRRSFVPLLAAAAIIAISLPLSSDIVHRGWVGVQSRRSADSNHGLNDRAAVRWLMAQRQHGNPFMTTELGLPAVWWYGGIRLSDDEQSAAHQEDGGLVLKAANPSSGDCAEEQLSDALSQEDRLLLYFGFPDQGRGFDDVVVNKLRPLGTIEGDRKFAAASRAVVIHSRRDAIDVRPEHTDGCVTVQLARRW